MHHDSTAPNPIKYSILTFLPKSRTQFYARE